MTEDRPWYNYREAAARVNRSPRTIRRWRKHGMPMQWDNQGRRIVKHEQLLSWYRKILSSDILLAQKNRKTMPDTPMDLDSLLGYR